MDTWALLTKELKYYGINLIDNKKCQLDGDNGDMSNPQGVIKTIRLLNHHVKKQKKLLLSLWNEIVDVLQEQDMHGISHSKMRVDYNTEIIDDDMISLFVFSLKDLTKYLLCFEGAERSKYYASVSQALSQDINSFSKDQVYSVPDYKISIDWISRNISRLLYITNLLSLASMGKNRVSQLDIKTAKGIAGPWSRLNLPMEERKFPFGFGLRSREKGKQKQNRYTKGLMNYNNDGRVGEGHYWRELRNEPYSWMDRAEEDPYPSMKMYTGRAASNIYLNKKLSKTINKLKVFEK